MSELLRIEENSLLDRLIKKIKTTRIITLSKVFEYQVQNKIVKAKNLSLQAKIKKLEKDIEILKKKHKKDLINLDKRNNTLSEDNMRMYVKCKRMERRLRKKDDDTRKNNIKSIINKPYKKILGD